MNVNQISSKSKNTSMTIYVHHQDHHDHNGHHDDNGHHDHNDDDPPALSKLPPQVLPGILLRRQTLGFV